MANKLERVWGGCDFRGPKTDAPRNHTTWKTKL
jgi:hypothetical protein